MATDPICGMNVEPNNAAGKHEHDGKAYYFCSKHCLTKFKEDPDEWVDAPRGGHVHGSPSGAKRPPSEAHADRQTPTTAKPVGAEYICPMDPEVRESKPGACPKCGMALEPQSPTAPASRIEYVCPMHPEIVRDEPGSCPICGMALEPRTATLDDAPNPELVDMTRRFWISAALSLPLFILAMSDMLPRQPLQHFLSPRLVTWVQFFLATPVVLW